MARGRRPGPGGPAWGSVHPLLDLHGMTGGEARLRAESWLRARQADGVRTVVVVTGRGNRSGGLPVLRGEVGDLLERLAGTVVAAWEAVDGGGGFRVTLRRLEPPPAASGVGAPPRGLDPALVRRAEEALWELGIAPTPALIQAEVRRILAEEGGG